VLTREEVRAVDADAAIREYVVRGYPKLQKAVVSLRESGVRAEDLSYLLREEGRTLWVDGMHANRIGHELALDRVYELIGKGGVSGRGARR
jgi:hypothetical protein